MGFNFAAALAGNTLASDALKKANKNPLKYKTVCQNRAKNFDVEIFIKKIKEKIKEK